MCVVILCGLRQNPMVEMGVDPFAEDVGYKLDDDCIRKK